MRTATSLCVFACILASSAAWADNKREFNQNVEDPDYAFKSMEVSIPAYPADDAQWLDLYVSPTYKNKPKIMPQSIQILGNASVTYILNNQSGNGIDNISFENLRCSTQSFLSEYNNGVRQIAFADTYNKRWLESRNAPWRDVGSNLSTTLPVQEMLSRVFCDGGLPRNDKEVSERLMSIGTFNPAQDRDSWK